MPENYVKVGQVSAIKPGMLTMTKVGDVEVMLANLDGEIYALDNFCPHEGWALHEGILEDDCVECPGHSHFYSVKTGQRTGVPEERATVIPCKVEGDDILVDLG